MKIYLMDTNKGRRIFINESKNWYYFAYLTNECNIDKAIEHLKNYIKGIYNSGNTVDISKFERIKEYGGCNIWEFLDSIHDYEIEHGVPHSDLSAIHFICEV